MIVTCPVCRARLNVASLSEATAAVQSCCQPKRARRKAKVQKPTYAPLISRESLILPVQFRFTRLVESQNATTYSHWNKHHSDKKDWLSRVQLQMAAYRGFNFEFSRWHMERVYAGRRREMDYANMVGGAKPLVDCLTLAQVIRDDAPKHFMCEYSQRRGDVSETILTLLEVVHDDQTADVRGLPRPDERCGASPGSREVSPAA